MRRLDGQVAIVTGGGGGLGKAIALRLAAHGADVAIAELDPAAAREAAAEVRALGRRALAAPTDVSSKSSVQTLVLQVVEELG